MATRCAANHAGFPPDFSKGNSFKPSADSHARPDAPRWKWIVHTSRRFSCKISRKDCRFSPPRRPCAPLPVCRRCFSHARRAVTVRRTPSAVGAQAGAAPRRALPACWFSHGLPVAAAPPLHPRHLRTVRRPHPRPPHTTQAAHAGLFPAACPGCWPLPPLASDGAQAAQLLGGPSVTRYFRSGRTPAARPPAPVRRAAALVCAFCVAISYTHGRTSLISSSTAGARLRPAPSSALLAVGHVAVVCASPRGGSPPSPRAALRPPPFPRRGCRRPMRIIRAGGRGFAPGPRTFGAVVACIARSLPRRFLCGRLRSLRSLRGLRPLPRPVRAPTRAPGSICGMLSLFAFR